MEHCYYKIEVARKGEIEEGDKEAVPTE